MVRHCRQQYNHSLAWFNKSRARKAHQQVIKEYFHNWLYERALLVIKERKQASYSAAVTAKNPENVCHETIEL